MKSCSTAHLLYLHFLPSNPKSFLSHKVKGNLKSNSSFWRRQWIEDHMIASETFSFNGRTRRQTYRGRLKPCSFIKRFKRQGKVKKNLKRNWSYKTVALDFFGLYFKIKYWANTFNSFHYKSVSEILFWINDPPSPKIRGYGKYGGRQQAWTSEADIFCLEQKATKCSNYNMVLWALLALQPEAANGENGLTSYNEIGPRRTSGGNGLTN